MAKNLVKELMVQNNHPKWFKGKEFVKRLEEGYLNQFKDTKFTTKKSFAPSSLAWNQGECPRYWYIAFSGADFIPDEKNAAAIANMQHGTVSHERIQKALAESGIEGEFEVEIRNEDPPVFGYADGILEWSGDDNVVLEIKTMREEGFARVKASGKAKKHHILQSLIYMHIRKATKGIILYESKNANELLAIPLEMNSDYQNWIEYAFDWMRTVRKAFDDKTLPRVNYRSNSRVCKGCPVKATCGTLGEGTLTIRSLEALPDVEDL